MLPEVRQQPRERGHRALREAAEGNIFGRREMAPVDGVAEVHLRFGERRPGDRQEAGEVAMREPAEAFRDVGRN